MEVRTRARSGISEVGYHVAALDPLSRFDVQSRIVGKNRFNAVSVADLSHVAVPGAETRLDYHAICGRHDRRPGLGRDIDSLVKLQDAAEWRGPVTEG